MLGTILGLLPIGEVSGDSLIVVGVAIILFFAVAYGLYTRKGSGIDQHPGPDAQDTVVGDQTKRTNEDLQEEGRPGVDRAESGEMDQRGTQ